MLRIILATLLSALWAPLYTAFFANLVFTGLSEVQADLSLLYKASINWTFGFVYGFIPMIVLSPLAHMVLRWKKYNSLFAYVTLWFLLSHMLWWGGINLPSVHDDVVGAMIRSILFNLPWIPAAVTFWTIAKPDSRNKKSSKVVDFDQTTTSKTTTSRQRSHFGMRGRIPR